MNYLNTFREICRVIKPKPFYSLKNYIIEILTISINEILSFKELLPTWTTTSINSRRFSLREITLIKYVIPKTLHTNY